MENTSSGSWFWVGVLGFLICSWIGDGVSAVAHSKVRYAVEYGVSLNQVTIEDKPRDCDFIKAPIGNKECYYERDVERSHDAYGQVTDVVVSWEKTDR